MTSGSRSNRMWVLIEDSGPFVVGSIASWETSVVGSYWSAVSHYRQTGDTSRLREFDGASVGGFPLETDPDEIDYWARRGELQFEDIYQS